MGSLKEEGIGKQARRSGTPTPKKRPSNSDLKEAPQKKGKRPTSVSELGAMMASVEELEDEEELFSLYEDMRRDLQAKVRTILPLTGK